VQMSVARWQRLALGALVALSMVASGCSSSDSTPALVSIPTSAAPIAVGAAPLRIELIRKAVVAVEAKLGGAQQYFEVNATPTLVNIFVAAQGATQAVAYVYDAAGTLQPPAAPQPASGPTFRAADITFDEALVLAPIVSQLPLSTFRVFSVVGEQAGGVTYIVTVDSKLGTEFHVTVGAVGKILGTDQMLAPPTT
jgi:hypothetical protein